MAAITTAPTTGGGAELLKGAPIVNLVIDVGDPDPSKPLSAAEQAAHDTYIKGIRDTAAALKAQGIPTVYIAITDVNRIHGTWDAETLKSLHMTGLDPQPGDVLFEKRFMSGFPTPEDIQGSPGLTKYLIGQRKDGANYADAFSADPNANLTALLKDAKHVIVNGMMGQFCVTDNSCDAARLGKGVTVVSSNVGSWASPDEYKKIIINDADFSAQQVQGMLDRLRQDPAARGMTPEMGEKLKSIRIMTTEQLLDNIHEIKASVTPPSGPAGSRFLPAAGTGEPHAEAAGPHADTSQRTGKALGAVSIAADLAEGRWGKAVGDAGIQASLNPETYSTAARLLGEAGEAAKVLGVVAKKIPVAGAIVTAGTVLYEVGEDVYGRQYGKATAALAAGAAETAGNVIGLGVGDVARETVREGVVLTAGSDYAPDKSGLRQLGERVVTLAASKPRQP